MFLFSWWLCRSHCCGVHPHGRRYDSVAERPCSFLRGRDRCKHRHGLWYKIVYGTGCGLWMTMEHRLSHSLSNIDRSMDVYSPWNKTVYSHQPMCIQCILYHNMVLYVCYNLVRESEVMDVRNKKCSLKVAFEDHFWLQWSFGASVSTGWEWSYSYFSQTLPP